MDAIERLFGLATLETVGEPLNLVPALGESLEVSERDTLRTACEGVLGITPIEHQKTHGVRKRKSSIYRVLSLPTTGTHAGQKSFVFSSQSRSERDCAPGPGALRQA